MGTTDVQDTVAFRVCRQMLDHTYGSDEELETPDFSSVAQDFAQRSGSWEELLNGSMAQTQLLSECIDRMMSRRKLLRVAARVAAVGMVRR